MLRREHVFVCILSLLAVTVGCSNSVDADRVINNGGSGQPGDGSTTTKQTRPATPWPPPAPEQTAPQAPAPVYPTKILTKDSEYIGLIKPPAGDGFLKLYSTDYNAKMSQVEANVANISDKALQEKARVDDWKNVDKATFQKQAADAHTTKLREYMTKHRDGWVEIGHCEYDPATKTFKVFSIPASPFQTSDKFEIHMEIATVDAVYNKFRSIAEPRIAARIDQDVMEYFAQEDSPVYSREQVTKFLREQRYKTYETRIRQEQMVVVGYGDLTDKSIQHVSVVDYASEAVLLELDPKIFAASNPSWLY